MDRNDAATLLESMERNEINIFCDGSCKPKFNNNGGWGVLMSVESKNGLKRPIIEYELYGGAKSVTNNIMELTAMIKALELASTGVEFTIHSDSMYVINGIVPGGEGHIFDGEFKGWLGGWMKNNWITSKKEPVKNRDLWERIIALCLHHHKNGSVARFKYVKAHCGIYGNEEADRLANRGAAEA